jgi:ribonuclease III
MRADAGSLEDRIGYRFTDAGLLRRALTHSSFVNEQNYGADSSDLHNEQLEFLGDAVLGLIASETLVSRFPAYREGRLSQLKHHIVSAVHLYEVARGLEIGRYLRLGRGEECSGGREKKTLVADALEALIAALYLDGGMTAARAFVLDFVLAAAGPGFGVQEKAPASEIVDYKSALQELARARGLPLPRYTIVRELGPAHARMFTVEVRLGQELSATGDGLTKKSAAQQAARGVYDELLFRAPDGPSAT